MNDIISSKTNHSKHERHQFGSAIAARAASRLCTGKGSTQNLDTCSPQKVWTHCLISGPQLFLSFSHNLYFCPAALVAGRPPMFKGTPVTMQDSSLLAALQECNEGGAAMTILR